LTSSGWIEFSRLIDTLRRIDLKTASVERSDTIRDINRQVVLNYIRERSHISRAETSSETALQRSTISLIVEELKSKVSILSTSRAFAYYDMAAQKWTINPGIFNILVGHSSQQINLRGTLKIDSPIVY
jgi:beta-glucosidase